jgi:hypothetical protein
MRSLGCLDEVGRSWGRIARLGDDPAAEQGVPRPDVARSLPPQAVADIEPDPRQPRPEALGAAQAFEGEHRLEDRFLGGVGGELLVAQGTAAEGDQQRPVAGDQEAECRRVSLARRRDQRRVVGLALALAFVAVFVLDHRGKAFSSLTQ